MSNTRATLLAVGTAGYDDVRFDTLAKVPGSLAQVISALEEVGIAASANNATPASQVTERLRELGIEPNPLLDGRMFLLDPSREELRAEIRAAARRAPVAIVYLTGHGAKPDADEFHAILRRTDPSDLSATALLIRDIAKLAHLENVPDDEQPDVLLVIDACFSGEGAADILEATRSGIGSQRLWILTSASRLEEASDGAFARALVAELNELFAIPNLGTLTEYIPLELLVGRMNANQGLGARVEYYPPLGRTDGWYPFFPVRQYRPEFAGFTVEEQRQWTSRLDGVATGSQGRYLAASTGRLEAVRQLASWIASTNSGLAVVTGGPGTGKSTLLALFVLNSQMPDSLAAIQPESDLAVALAALPPANRTLAVYARGLGRDDVATRIGDGLGVSATTWAALRGVLNSQPIEEATTIVIDALDEANDSSLLETEINATLNRPNLRVVLGARPNVAKQMKGPALQIDLDAPAFQDEHALTEYVADLLCATREPEVQTPYERGSVAAVAREIAARATTEHSDGRRTQSFLLAGLLAVAIRGKPRAIDPLDSDAFQTLPRTVADAFDADLNRLGEFEPRGRALLTALAWAGGPGIPWNTIWIPVANELSRALEWGVEVSDADIEIILNVAGSYVVEDQAQWRGSVFRLFHDLLAQYLRGEIASEPGNAQDPGVSEKSVSVQAAIVRALTGTVPRDDS